MSAEKNILIITGDKGSGKTTLCLEIIRKLNAEGRSIAGVVSPAIVEAGIKTGIQLMDVRSGEKAPLARLRGKNSIGVSTQRWEFFPDAVNLGNKILAEIISCEYLFIDELGPLEFNRNEGWMNGFMALEKAEYQTAIVVIRPGLMNLALRRWPSADFFQVKPGRDLEIETEVLLLKLLSTT